MGKNDNESEIELYRNDEIQMELNDDGTTIGFEPKRNDVIEMERDDNESETEIALHSDDNIETKRNGERTETGFEITRLDKMIKESFDEGTKLAFTLRPQDEVAIETDFKLKRIDEMTY